MKKILIIILAIFTLAGMVAQTTNIKNNGNIILREERFPNL